MKIPFYSSLPRRQQAVLAGSALAVVAAIAIAAVILLSGPKTPDSALPSPIPTAQTTPQPSAVPETTAQPASVDPAEIGTVLPETADAGRTYIDETLFIGDSNTARYMMYADDSGKAFTTSDNNIGVVSMGAGAITTLQCEQFTGSSKMYTVPDAVAMLKPKRIIICYGTNNLGGTSTDATSFINTYLKGLKAIRDAWPYCDIIVSAIPPLDKQRANTRLEMTQVDAYNAAIEKMCGENDFKFLNTSEVLRDSATGWAKKDYTLSDGVHLSKTAVTAYFTYVRTHAYITADRRPQPLGTVAKPVGVPVNLIKEDPIAVRDAKVPLEFVMTGKGTLSGETSQLVRKGSTASAVTAKPEKGWLFKGWLASDGTVYEDATLAFVMPSTANAGGEVLTAVFKECDHKYPDTEEYKNKSPLVLDEGNNQYPENCTLEHEYIYTCKLCKASVRVTKALYEQHEWNESAGEDGKIHCKHTGCKQVKPTATPTPSPTPTPTPTPTPKPTVTPTSAPTPTPTATPTPAPTTEPTAVPTAEPTAAPTTEPTAEPTTEPTTEPTVEPTTEPTIEPTTGPAPPSEPETPAAPETPTEGESPEPA